MLRKSIIAVPLFVLIIANMHNLNAFAQSQGPAIAMADPATAPVATGASATAQPSAAPAGSAAAQTEAAGAQGLSRMGIAINLSPTLGPGIETAYEVTQRINVRGAFNFFKYTDNLTSDGVNYGGSLKLQSEQINVDYFLWRSLHVSPGLLVSDGNLLTAALGVPGGQTFTLSGTTFESDPANPLGGTGALKFNRVAPSILVGFGNLVPRGYRRFSVAFEIGGAYRGTPKIGLDFTGNACSQIAMVCQPVASYAAFENSVTEQQTKFTKDISFLKFYPIISLEFGFRL
jgi:hypothetical protein